MKHLFGGELYVLLKISVQENTALPSPFTRTFVAAVDLFEYMVYLGAFHVPLSKRGKEDFLKLLEIV